MLQEARLLECCRRPDYWSAAGGQTTGVQEEARLLECKRRSDYWSAAGGQTTGVLQEARLLECKRRPDYWSARGGQTIIVRGHINEQLNLAAIYSNNGGMSPHLLGYLLSNCVVQEGLTCSTHDVNKLEKTYSGISLKDTLGMRTPLHTGYFTRSPRRP